MCIYIHIKKQDRYNCDQIKESYKYQASEFCTFMCRCWKIHWSFEFWIWALKSENCCRKIRLLCPLLWIHLCLMSEASCGHGVTVSEQEVKKNKFSFSQKGVFHNITNVLTSEFLLMSQNLWKEWMIHWVSKDMSGFDESIVEGASSF